MSLFGEGIVICNFCKYDYYFVGLGRPLSGVLELLLIAIIQMAMLDSSRETIESRSFL